MAKKKPAAAKPGKPKQDPPDGVTPPPMFKREKITKVERTPAGPTIPPKRKGNVTKAPKAPKTRAISTGKSQQNRYDQEQWTPRPKPYFEGIAQPELPIEAQRHYVPSRGYNYTDGSYTGATPQARAREVDQARMNGQAAGQRRRRANEVMIPGESEAPPVPKRRVPNEQWGAAPKKNKAPKLAKTWKKTA